MKIIIKNEEFKSKKLVGKLYELYLEISEKSKFKIEGNSPLFK